jgi:hypothetical protein
MPQLPQLLGVFCSLTFLKHYSIHYVSLLTDRQPRDLPALPPVIVYLAVADTVSAAGEFNHIKTIYQDINCLDTATQIT